MRNLENFLKNLNNSIELKGSFRFDEPMGAHTTFKVGGPADLWIRPDPAEFPEFCPLLLKNASAEGLSVFILGGGANIVVSDAGIRGIVLDLGAWTGMDRVGESGLSFRSGTSLDAAANAAADAGLTGLEFLAGMPGSIGGGVWMNARCYETSMSDVLTETEILDETFRRVWVKAKTEDFGYKKSPFQNRRVLILSARFLLAKDEPARIRHKMEEHRRDREAKGHYRFPSAGSAFKNNRDFGKPTGKIIDELGLRGRSRGGAAIAPWHGNLLINTGGASAEDIRALVEEVTEEVYRRRGIILEPEILFINSFGKLVCRMSLSNQFV
ncbi:MAG: UDP-N-acetylmuramate dehydrogenase [Spirochaetaceae bacterium]|nr:UDP-N-acetylmuramate dehydrogenase [Spirochaetaceae bacterium]